MMGCFSTSQTDGTEESFRMSLRSLLATKETPIPAPCIAKKIIERKLGFGTRKTLQARTNLLDTACHSLAKAKQRTLVSLPPSYYIKSEILLFPLPLPPGYKPTINSKPSIKSISAPPRKLLTANSSSATSDRVHQKVNGDSTNATSSSNIGKKVDDLSADFSLISSNSSCSPGHSSNSTSHLYSCEALTPTSPTSSSSVFSAATPYCLSQSSSFNSSSTTCSDRHCNSLSYALENEVSSFFTGPQSAGSPLKEFSLLEIARAFESSGHIYKLTDGAMGPFYRVVLPEEKSCVAITRVATKLSRKKWRAQVQALARLAQSNLSKVIGFSYERAKYVNGLEGRMSNDNMGFIVYEDIGDETLEDFLQDLERGIDWSIRLKLAIGIAEGLSYLLENMPGHVDYGDLTMSNIRVDFSLSVKLFDFVLSSTNIGNLKEKRLCNVVQSFGNVLLQVFDFVSYSQNGGSKATWHYKGVCPQNDARVVADIATNCLLSDASLRPSVRQVARVLRSIEPTQNVANNSSKCSKSFTYRRKKSLSFG